MDREKINKEKREYETEVEKTHDTSSKIMHSTSFILHKLLDFSTEWIKMTANVKVLKIMKI